MLGSIHLNHQPSNFFSRFANIFPMSSISTQKASLWSSSTPQWKYDVFLSFREKWQISKGGTYGIGLRLNLSKILWENYGIN
ncbi:hypothetical protein CMV_013719 [Castanea mollissima]|uniref:Uncharacterized protein n=1 Tax=Castanea mollissima TaxID=60419 RepID=A0A8J4VLP5_9ROSI|nr:hypothetical protein CMV_013719 [Castanea mollissima]